MPRALKTSSSRLGAAERPRSATARVSAQSSNLLEVGLQVEGLDHIGVPRGRGGCIGGVVACGGRENWMDAGKVRVGSDTVPSWRRVPPCITRCRRPAAAPPPGSAWSARRWSRPRATAARRPLRGDDRRRPVRCTVYARSASPARQSCSFCKTRIPDRTGTFADSRPLSHHEITATAKAPG